MKRYYQTAVGTIFCILLFGLTTLAQVAINTTNSAPDPTAMLDVSSSSKGLLIPRLTEAQRLAISGPATGLFIYQTDGLQGLYYNAGSALSPDWKRIVNDGLGLNGTTGQTIWHNGTGWEAASYLNINATGNVGIGTSAGSDLLTLSQTNSARALYLQIGGASNSSNVLEALTYGTGNAGVFSISNTGNSSNALYASTNGTGWAAAFYGGTLVRGRGTTNSTQAFRIENSTGSSLLRVFDNGNAALGAVSALNYGGYSSVGSLANKRGLTIASATSYTADAPAVLELVGSATNVGEELGMLEFLHQSSNGSTYNVARIAAIRENANPTYTAIAFYTRKLATLSERARITNDGYFHPTSDGTQYLGLSTHRWLAVYATNGTIQTSDRRLKNNIKPIRYGLEEVLKMQPVSYNWKQDGKSKIGLIAQDVQALVPEVIEGKETPKEYLGMNYAELVPVLIKAIQQQQEIISKQEKKLQSNDEQHNRLVTQQATLRAELDALKARFMELTKSLETLLPAKMATAQPEVQ